MKIDIQASDFSITDSMHKHICKRVESNLAFCEAHVVRTVVRLSDINGPKGGHDKCCLLQIALVGMPDVIIDNKADDLYAAIDQAASRAGRTIRRRLTRRRDRSRTSRTVPLDVTPAEELTAQTA